MIPRAASPLLLRRCLRSLTSGPTHQLRTKPTVRPAYSSRQAWRSTRWYASTSSSEADAAIEEIQELYAVTEALQLVHADPCFSYATAKDEFEIAAEETEKKSVYGSEDREAAKEELKKLKDAYNEAVKRSCPEVGAEIQRRVGQRIRELENAVTAMEESAMED